MKSQYDFQAIEAKWKKAWEQENLYKVDLSHSGNKYYCLDMYPYPSGEGLHVGHWRGYVLSDFYARYQRLLGKIVFHPMGFDSFGLPAENAAIKNKSHPKEFTNQAIETFSRQLKQVGASYDWSKEVRTSDPNYYHWTQWLFLQFFKHGLAEKRNSLVNWCPKDQTVLANEQVKEGCCERCGSRVTKKELSQWYLKTTKFSQELLQGLDDLDWPEHVKILQRNWIGKSIGVNVIFSTKDKSQKVEVFTTRPDTLYGVTAVVLAPENPLSKNFVTPENRESYKKYLDVVASKTNISRQQAKESEKTAFFTGGYLIHPLTNEELPVWLADYVLLDYGTGAIMSVPAHDERDYLFAKAHNLEIKPVIKDDKNSGLPYLGDGQMINSEEFTGQDNRTSSEAIIKKLESLKAGQATVTYRLRDWLVSRQRYWGAPIPIVYDPEGQPHAVEEEHLPLLLPEDVDFFPGGESPITRSHEYLKRAETLYGKGWRFETDTLDTFVDSSWYYLRYLSPDNKKEAFDKNIVKNWLPIDLYIGGIEHATMHLLYARFVTRFLSKYGYIDKNITEPFTKLFNIGMITLHGAKMSKSRGNSISPDPLIEHYGTDALRGYELFIGPMDIEAEWNVRGINGIHKFLIKVNDLKNHLTDTDSSTTRLHFNKYLEAINPMIETFRLNTYISEAMKFVNIVSRDGISKEMLGRYVITLSPIFPFVGEEIWHTIGGKDSVFKARWPEAYKDTSQKLTKQVILQSKKPSYLGNIPLNGNKYDQEALDLLLSNKNINSNNITIIDRDRAVIIILKN